MENLIKILDFFREIYFFMEEEAKRERKKEVKIVKAG